MAETARAAVGALRDLVVAVVLLGVLLGAAGCSASNGEETAAEATKLPRDPAKDDAAVAYWLKKWGSAPHDGPMYLRLPAGVDTRGWVPMNRGYWAYLAAQKGFNRPASDNYEKDYEFSWDVFTWNIPLWRSILEGFAGKPDLRYLEIGVSEGRAILWMLENVLTHPTSRATAVDPFMVEGHEERLRENLNKSPRPDAVQVIVGFSQQVLPGLEPESYDIIYIDGSHLAGDVLFDAVYTWRLLRAGGVVIHDDYMWYHDKPPDIRPLVAVDAFITGMRNTAEVLHRGRQLVLRKRPLDLPDFCWNRDPCLRVGNYLYAWNSDRLLQVGTDAEIQLSVTETTVLKEILLNRRIGAEAELLLEEDVTAIRSRFPQEFERLSALLELRISSPPPSRIPGGSGEAAQREPEE
jgi:predicted O-methyltransferase YrrM